MTLRFWPDAARKLERQRQASPTRFVIPFGVGLLCLVGLVLLPLIGALFGVGWYTTDALEQRALTARIRSLETSISILSEEGFRTIGYAQQSLADSGIYADAGSAIASPTGPGRSAILNMVRRHPNMTAGYVGFADGGFLYVTQIDRLAEARRLEIGAPSHATFAIRIIAGQGGERRETWSFLDGYGAEIASKPAPNPAYDPRARVWFQDAIKADRTIITEPYAFAGAGGLGITVATPLGSGSAVIGADLSLASASRLLSIHKISPSSQIVVATENGGILARTDLSLGPTAPPQGELVDWMVSEVRQLAGGDRQAAVGGRTVGGVDFRLHTRAFSAVFGRRFYLAVAAPVAELTAETSALIQRSGMVALAAAILAIAGVALMSRLLARPLANIADKTDRFRQLDFSDARRVVSRVSEIDRLEAAIERMRGGLEQFGRFVPRQLVQRVIDLPGGASVGGARQAVTILFTDIERFSQVAEHMDPELLMTRLSKYLESLGGALTRNGGTIDKYIGDSIMAMWNAPDPDPDHVANACRAALAVAKTSLWLEAKWERHRRDTFHTRVGLHTGVAVVGNVGSSDRMNYTVVGAVPNQASRLEGLNKIYGTLILASGQVYDAARDGFVWRELDWVVPAGATDELQIFELLDEAGVGSELSDRSRVEFLSRWNGALAAYRRCDIPNAAEAFRKLAELCPQDGPTRLFLGRCDALLEHGVPPGWTAVTTFREK